MSHAEVPASAPAGSATLTAIVREQHTEAPLPAWVCITGADGAVVQDWRVHESLPGFPCDGSFSVALPPGPVRVAVHRGLAHEWALEEFVAEPGRSYERTYTLAPWAPLRAQGWFCGDSHNHMQGQPREVARYCRALGLDYLNVCQDWLHPGGPGTPGQVLADYYRQHSCGDFHMHFGAERPKTRYGHTWWWNLTPFADPFAERLPWHDVMYFEEAAQVTEDVIDLAARLPFRNELPFKTWKRYRDQGAACALAHPTSWWLDRPDAKLITTNIAAELPFALLAGGLVDALVVMGYDADQIFYQNTWFHILNEGYDLPGVAETDGSLTGKHHVGQLRDYVQVPAGRYSPAGLVQGLRRGRVLLSSGPLVTLSVDGGRYEVGDHLPADGAEHELAIAAWADPRPGEFLSYLVVYRNGAVFRQIDLTAQRPRRHALTLRIRETGARAWYVVKAYGSTYPQQDIFFDVLRYAELCERKRHTEYVQLTQVALTNPVYFVPLGWRPPAAVVCAATIRVVDAATGAPLADAAVRVLEYERELTTLWTDAAGVARLRLPPTAEVEVRVPGRPAVRQSVFLDYPPVRECLEYCFAGRWRAPASPLQPGQVPWPAFRFAELRAALQTVEWTIALPRDGAAQG